MKQVYIYDSIQQFWRKTQLFVLFDLYFFVLLIFYNNFFSDFMRYHWHTIDIQYYICLGFSHGSAVKNVPAMQELQETLVQS